MSEAVLECRSVVRRFDEGGSTLEVLSGVDLSVKAGERMAIIGASGSGKTTLLQIMGGLDAPTSGEVLVGGQPMHEVNEIEKGELRNRYLGFVYQFHHLLAEFSAAENVAMPLVIGRMERAEAMRRAMKLLMDLGLSDRFSHLPSQLSGGEQQRVAVARALVTEPSLVLADEPTGNLDTGNAEELVALFRHLHEARDLTSVIVTHSPAVALVCDRTFYMEEGRLRS